MIAPAAYVVSTGARTPLGLRAAPSAAALRAGIVRISEHPLLLNRLGEPLLGGRDARLDPALMGPERLISLATTALHEACVPVSSYAPDLGHRVPLYLGLPEARPGFSEQDVLRVRRGVEKIEGLPLALSDVTVFPLGHAAGMAALQAAIRSISRGECDSCIVGGVDSYFHPHTVEWYDKHRQLVAADTRSAFVPGEGAGFFSLVSERIHRRLSGSPWRVCSWSPRPSRAR